MSLSQLLQQAVPAPPISDPFTPAPPSPWVGLLGSMVKPMAATGASSGSGNTVANSMTGTGKPPDLSGGILGILGKIAPNTAAALTLPTQAPAQSTAAAAPASPAGPSKAGAFGGSSYNSTPAAEPPDLSNEVDSMKLRETAHKMLEDAAHGVEAAHQMPTPVLQQGHLSPFAGALLALAAGTSNAANRDSSGTNAFEGVQQNLAAQMQAKYAAAQQQKQNAIDQAMARWEAAKIQAQPYFDQADQIEQEQAKAELANGKNTTAQAIAQAADRDKLLTAISKAQTPGSRALLTNELNQRFYGGKLTPDLIERVISSETPAETRAATGAKEAPSVIAKNTGAANAANSKVQGGGAVQSARATEPLEQYPLSPATAKYAAAKEFQTRAMSPSLRERALSEAVQAFEGAQNLHALVQFHARQPGAVPSIDEAKSAAAANMAASAAIRGLAAQARDLQSRYDNRMALGGSGKEPDMVQLRSDLDQHRQMIEELSQGQLANAKQLLASAGSKVSLFGMIPQSVNEMPLFTQANAAIAAGHKAGGKGGVKEILKRELVALRNAAAASQLANQPPILPESTGGYGGNAER